MNFNNTVDPMVTQTTVIQTQPTTIIQMAAVADVFHPRGTRRDWSTSLCGCFEDCLGCMAAMWFPLCYECYVSSKMGEDCCMPYCVPNATLVMRAHLRGRHNIEGSIMKDCCITHCCYLCALCQISREVDNLRDGRAIP